MFCGAFREKWGMSYRRALVTEVMACRMYAWVMNGVGWGVRHPSVGLDGRRPADHIHIHPPPKKKRTAKYLEYL